jgi:mannan endo-1,4-beta-mannosidase
LHRRVDRPRPSARKVPTRKGLIVMVLAAATAAGLFLAVNEQSGNSGGLSTKPDSYLGVYVTGIPHSYDPVRHFVGRTGVRPNIVLYYSAWWEPFRAKFAATAARHNQVPLVQINPEHVSLASIAAGQWDSYLDRFAAQIRAYHHSVILGFGHEVNARWSQWGYRHASPATFVAAWRHIVDVFRAMGVRNVTWLWTVNVIDVHAESVDPGPWWPGPKYVTWVGIDGYYRQASWRFDALFGPTIKAVRKLTLDPILISETGVAPRAGKAEKIGNLFAGIRAYGLLGVVWFNAVAHQDWRLDNPAAITAFHRAVVATSAGQ